MGLLALLLLLLFVLSESDADNKQLFVLSSPIDDAVALRTRVASLPSVAAASSSLLNATLAKEGFHRDLRLSSRLALPDAVNQLLVLFTLPKETYVDTFELENQALLGLVPRLLSRAVIDVERPSYRTNYAVIVAICTTLKEERQDITTEAVIPVHLRYQEPSDSSPYAPVSIAPPIVLVRTGPTSSDITLDELDSLGASASSWKRVLIENSLFSLNTTMPVGLRDHETLVFAGTLALTLGCGSYLIWAILTTKY